MEAAYKAELDRGRREHQSVDLTKCFEQQNGGLHASALELLKPPAKETAERGAARQVPKLQNWKQLGPAQQPESGAGRPTTFSGNLKAHSAAAAKLVRWWQQHAQVVRECACGYGEERVYRGKNANVIARSSRSADAPLRSRLHGQP